MGRNQRQECQRRQAVWRQREKRPRHQSSDPHCEASEATSVKAPQKAALASSSVLSGRWSSQMPSAKELMVNKDRECWINGILDIKGKIGSKAFQVLQILKHPPPPWHSSPITLGSQCTGLPQLWTGGEHRHCWGVYGWRELARLTC